MLLRTSLGRVSAASCFAVRRREAPHGRGGAFGAAFGAGLGFAPPWGAFAIG